MKTLVFLKLGGSLITDKHTPHAPNREMISFLAGEIRSLLQTQSDLSLLLGHGSGSFGHVPASQYHTREGVHSAEEWEGFVHVWLEASALNRMVIELFADAGIPVISIAPSASLTSSNGQVDQWNTAPIQQALEHNLVPITFGDVLFDRILGGTIFSTEQLFEALTPILHPAQILITGSEPGVWKDYPACTEIIQEITPDSYPFLSKTIFPSGAIDVTGGMSSKVAAMVALVSKNPNLRVTIFNPITPGTISKVLAGEAVGTVIHQ